VAHALHNYPSMALNSRHTLTAVLVGWLGVSALLPSYAAAAQSLPRLCRRECGATIQTVCDGTTTHKQFRWCRNEVLKVCRQRGVDVCAPPAPPAPPANPACGPTCPTGGPAVWTGTISSADGGTAELVASMCPTPDGLLTGGWSCIPGTAECVASGASLQAQLIGANFTAHSRVGSSFIDPIWGCDFTGLLNGRTLNGTYRCDGYGGTYTGTWQATACS